MLVRRLVLALACAGTCLWALTQTSADDTSGATESYIPVGSELNYKLATAPLPGHTLGPIALSALKVLDDPSAPVPSVLGQAPDGEIPPPGWPNQPLTGLVGKARFAADDSRGKCRCKTSLGKTDARRIAVLYATRTFTVGEELDRVRLLQLKARYNDGLIAYINGVEVARRNLDPEAGTMAIARRPHGPEWETFYITVVPGLLKRGDNLLAIEVHPSGRRLAPTLDLSLTRAQGGRIVRGPIVQRVSETSATVLFETDLPVTGVIEYGATAERGQIARTAGGSLAIRHEIELTDLAPGKPVHYRVIAGEHATEPLVFHTTPSSSDVVRFVVYGDVRGGHKVHGALIKAIVKEAPDFVVVTGDLVLRGTDEGDWQRFFSITADLMARVPYYPAVGNHDMGKSGDQQRRLNEIFALWPGPEARPAWGHWYSFDVAGIHFVMLDSNSYEYAKQLKWLERDLKDARERGVRAIFASTHDGPYSRGIHRGNEYAAKHYVPVLSRYGVNLTFSGHDHQYMRGEINGFAYIVSGGGGAPLYSVRCGVPGKRRCRVKDGMQHVAKEHHYVLLTVYPDHISSCAKRADGTPLEKCVTYRLRRKRRKRRKR